MNIPETEGYDNGMRGSTVVKFALLQTSLTHTVLVRL